MSNNDPKRPTGRAVIPIRVGRLDADQERIEKPRPYTIELLPNAHLPEAHLAQFLMSAFRLSAEHSFKIVENANQHGFGVIGVCPNFEVAEGRAVYYGQRWSEMGYALPSLQIRKM